MARKLKEICQTRSLDPLILWGISEARGHPNPPKHRFAQTDSSWSVEHTSLAESVDQCSPISFPSPPPAWTDSRTIHDPIRGRPNCIPPDWHFSFPDSLIANLSFRSTNVYNPPTARRITPALSFVGTANITRSLGSLIVLRSLGELCPLVPPPPPPHTLAWETRASTENAGTPSGNGKLRRGRVNRRRIRSRERR